jgi:hypothetical protein
MKFRRKLMWLGSLAGLSVALLLVLPASRGEGKSASTITIMGSSSINGETSPCG